MKNRKSIISLLLVLCICLSSMAMFASAADVGAKQVNAIRVVTCQATAANFRSAPDESDPENIIGNLMRGEDFHTASSPYDTWFFGTPGPETALYAMFGPSVKGHIKATAFNRY